MNVGGCQISLVCDLANLVFHQDWNGLWQPINNTDVKYNSHDVRSSLKDETRCLFSCAWVYNAILLINTWALWKIKRHLSRQETVNSYMMKHADIELHSIYYWEMAWTIAYSDVNVKLHVLHLHQAELHCRSDESHRSWQSSVQNTCLLFVERVHF